jgi:hypothetical protein
MGSLVGETLKIANGFVIPASFRLSPEWRHPGPDSGRNPRFFPTNQY